MSRTLHGSLHYANGQERFDAQGRKQKYLYCAAAATAGDFRKISYDTTILGLCAVALASATGTYSRVVVAAEDVAALGYGWFYVEGSGISATLAAAGTGTATHALRVTGGAVSTLGATIAYGNTEFGIIDTTFATTTAITVTLLGRECVETA